MNINMANSRYLDLFGRNNIAISGKIHNAKTSNGARVADVKTSKGNLDYSVSISEESKAMLEQPNEEKKQGGLMGALSYRDPDSVIILEGTVSFGSDKWRLLHAAYQRDDLQSGGGLNFNKLESAFDEIREELQTLYTGEQLEAHLDLLNESYEDALAHITKNIKQAINFRWKLEGKEGATAAIEAIFRNHMGFVDDMLTKMGVSKNQSIMGHIDTIVKTLAQNARDSIEASKGKVE